MRVPFEGTAWERIMESQREINNAELSLRRHIGTFGELAAKDRLAFNINPQGYFSGSERSHMVQWLDTMENELGKLQEMCRVTSNQIRYQEGKADASYD